MGLNAVLIHSSIKVYQAQQDHYKAKQLVIIFHQSLSLMDKASQIITTIAVIRYKDKIKMFGKRNHNREAKHLNQVLNKMESFFTLILK